MRYESHLSRQLYKAKHEFEALQKQRPGETTPIAPAYTSSARSASSQNEDG